MVKRLLIGLVAALLAFPALAQIPGGPVVVPSGSWAAAPPTTTAGRLYRATNVGPSGTLMVSNGTRWKPVAGCTFMGALDTAANSPGADTVLFTSALFPANLIQLKDRLRVRMTLSRNVTTDNISYNMRIGTAGTTADTVILGGALLASTNLSAGVATDFRLETATTISHLVTGAPAVAGGYSQASTSAISAAVALASSVATNPVYFTLSVSSAGATVGTLNDVQIDYCATPN